MSASKRPRAWHRRYVLNRRQQRALWLMAAIQEVVGAALPPSAGLLHNGGVGVVVGACWWGFLTALAAWSIRQSFQWIICGADGLSWRGFFFRPQQLAWHDITSISRYTYSSRDGGYSAMHLRVRGRRRRLRPPLPYSTMGSAADPGFDRCLSEIYETWRRSAGKDAAPLRVAYLHMGQYRWHRREHLLDRRALIRQVRLLRSEDPPQDPTR